MPADSVRKFYDTALHSMRSDDLDRAESLCRRAQVIYPRDPNITCLLGEVLLKQRRPQEAEGWFRRTLKHFPGFPRALEGNGKALLAQKRAKEAVQVLRRAAEALPERSSTHLALGRALGMAGQGPEAEAAVRRALELNPQKAVVAEAAELFIEGDHHGAEKILREHLAEHPEDPLALRLLGKLAMETGHRRQALRLLGRATQQAPDFVLAWNDFAEALLAEEDFPRALEAVDKALALDDQLAHLWVTRGNILAKSQRHDEALDTYAKALEIAPQHAGALAQQGHVLKTIGRTDEAIRSYRACIAEHPAFGEAYWSLANLKTFSFEPDEVEALEHLVSQEEVGEEPRVNMLYALGKHYENQQDYARAFEHYRAGADLRRGLETYDPVQNQLIHERIMEVFDAGFMQARLGWGDPSPDPILIVGLPRSGSTLIEQILASHSQVEGTMELPDLSRCIREINQARKDRVEYPDAVRELSAEDIRSLGQRYLRGAARFRSGKAYFIDKMPNNFTNLGLLHLMLPNAKIINARRHPLDSCLGSYKQLFYKGQSFTYDFFELGQFYLQYQRIMDHWHALMPGKILDLHYEDMVRDQEGQTRRLLDYCGLPFEEACLRFYETRRAINTASSEQVRRPIYTKGLNFWRHYEPQLGELIEQLEPLLRQLPEADRAAIAALSSGRFRRFMAGSRR